MVVMRYSLRYPENTLLINNTKKKKMVSTLMVSYVNTTVWYFDLYYSTEIHVPWIYIAKPRYFQEYRSTAVIWFWECTMIVLCYVQKNFRFKILKKYFYSACMHNTIKSYCKDISNVIK